MLLWLLAVLSVGDPNEWSTFPAEKPTSAGKKSAGGAQAATPSPGTAAGGGSAPVPAAVASRYRDAVAHMNAGRYQEATALLNQLAAEAPKVAELFAARCSAQLSLKQPQYAEADCAYALKLKPNLSMALFGLASAEEALGKRELAARHFREYERDPSARSDLREQAGHRATALLAAPAAAPAPGAPAPAPVVRRSTKPECKVGSNGRQACGYNCAIGTDGVSACADTPDGTCAPDADGHVTCTQLAVRGGANAGGKVPECRTGRDGLQVCGYNCRMGTNGRYFCATLPEGQCTQNSDGTFTCL